MCRPNTWHCSLMSMDDMWPCCTQYGRCKELYFKASILLSQVLWFSKYSTKGICVLETWFESKFVLQALAKCVRSLQISQISAQLKWHFIQQPDAHTLRLFVWPAWLTAGVGQSTSLRGLQFCNYRTQTDGDYTGEVVPERLSPLYSAKAKFWRPQI